jgi:hypothetical protein
MGMLSMTLLNAFFAASQVTVSGLPGAIACVLLFAVSCVARAQAGRRYKRSRRLRPTGRDERLPDGGRCDRERF